MNSFKKREKHFENPYFIHPNESFEYDDWKR